MKTARVVTLRPGARIPHRGSDGAAGYDLHSAIDVIAPPGVQTLVPTGLAIAVPEGTYGRVAPRSGLAVKRAIDVLAGVVDPDFRGEVCVVLFNHSKEPFEISAGDRIAQMVFETCETPEIVRVDSLAVTGRAAQGFGSTGV